MLLSPNMSVKAPMLISSTPSGMTDVLQPRKSIFPPLERRQLPEALKFGLSGSADILSRSLQLWKANVPIVFVGGASKAPALIERRSSYLYHVYECERFRKFVRIEGSIPDLYHGIRDARDVQTMAESEGVIPDLHQSVGKDCTLKGPARVESMTSNHTDAVW